MEVAPIAAKIDHEGKIPTELVKKLSEAGFMGIYIPESNGGAGMDYMSYAIIVEEISRNCASTGVLISAHTSLCLWPIFYVCFGCFQFHRYRDKFQFHQSLNPPNPCFSH
jgi:alkylation response protein AidB-like acyl-CoA dehydrogenase